MIDSKNLNWASEDCDALLSCLEIGKVLTSTTDLKEILSLIMNKVSQLVAATNWSLLLKNEVTGELSFEIAVGLNHELVKGLKLKPGDGLAPYSAETGKTIILSDAKNDLRFNPKIDGITGFSTESIICIPLKIHGKVIGIIEILNITDMNVVNTKEFAILKILADYAAIAIKNSQYFAKIQNASIIDEYTGLYNSRYMHKILDDLVIDAYKNKTELGVAFVDIDNFKEVVDKCGHLLGSQVLKEIGFTISSYLSDKDILVKYGGDEYIIILPKKNRQEVAECVEKIREAIKDSVYLKSELNPIKLTASFGIAMYPEDATTKKDLLLLADKFMYRIKRSTKNGIGMAHQ
ncbi:MAG: sensor domain-containing diguanylate cyclase [Desulfobacterales bacterium]|nr:sensor domain-containing diguanylate cyclase [Desulfobacterales bacterium]